MTFIRKDFVTQYFATRESKIKNHLLFNIKKINEKIQLRGHGACKRGEAFYFSPRVCTFWHAKIVVRAAPPPSRIISLT